MSEMKSDESSKIKDAAATWADGLGSWWTEGLRESMGSVDYRMALITTMFGAGREVEKRGFDDEQGGQFLLGLTEWISRYRRPSA